MIIKTEHYQKMYIKSWDAGFDETHIETHKIIMYWFLFIPIFKYKKIISNQIPNLPQSKKL